MHEPRTGHLFYIMGPSGSGKDTLLAGVRERLAHRPGYRFPRRLITRRRDYGGEDHVAISEQDFQTLLERDMLALHWQAHGFSYGISSDIDDWLQRGQQVIVSGSRHAFAQALARYPSCIGVLVTAPDEVLDDRLQGRRREFGSDLEARVARRPDPELPAERVVRLINDADIPTGIERLASILLGQMVTSASV